MTENESRPQGPGLKWRKRRNGLVPYWFASPKAIEKGYIKSVNLARYANDPVALLERVQLLQLNMMSWLEGPGAPVFDGTFRSLFNLYETDPESTFHGNTARTRKAYLVYL